MSERAEVWAMVAGWPYEVSNDGRVRRASDRGQNTFNGRLLKPVIGSTGYPKVTLRSVPRRPWTVSVHTIVAVAFLGPAPNGQEHVRHRNGDPTDNRLENLEWSIPHKPPPSKVRPLTERMAALIEVKPSGCWEWLGSRSADGYGVIQINGSPKRAHRISYELHRGPIPDGMFVCHSCDNRPCVNPAHLWLGTGRDNARDAAAKGRLNRDLSHLRGREAKGETHGFAKLTNKDVIQIRELVGAGNTQSAVAVKFGVDRSEVSRIVRRERWAHV